MRMLLCSACAAPPSLLECLFRWRLLATRLREPPRKREYQRQPQLG